MSPKHPRFHVVIPCAGTGSRAGVDIPKQYAPLAGVPMVMHTLKAFAAVPGLQRPSNQSPWPRLSLAGDWTDTGYPAVLEGAVRSGKQAAQVLMANFMPEP